MRACARGQGWKLGDAVADSGRLARRRRAEMFATRVLLGNPVKKGWKSGLLWKPQKWTTTRYGMGGMPAGSECRAARCPDVVTGVAVRCAHGLSQEAELAPPHQCCSGCVCALLPTAWRYAPSHTFKCLVLIECWFCACCHACSVLSLYSTAQPAMRRELLASSPRKKSWQGRSEWSVLGNIEPSYA